MFEPHILTENRLDQILSFLKTDQTHIMIQAGLDLGLPSNNTDVIRSMTTKNIN